MRCNYGRTLLNEPEMESMHFICSIVRPEVVSRDVHEMGFLKFFWSREFLKILVTGFFGPGLSPF